MLHVRLGNLQFSQWYQPVLFRERQRSHVFKVGIRPYLWHRAFQGSEGAPIGHSIQSSDKDANPMHLYRPTYCWSRTTTLTLHTQSALILQTAFPVTLKTKRRAPSRNPIAAELHPRSNVPISGGARYPLCAQRTENHLEILEDELPHEESILWRELDA